MRGIPGAGKTTLVKSRWPDATICSANFYFETPEGYVFKPEELPQAHQQCLRAFVEAVRGHDATIVVDNTNLTVDEIRPYLAVAQAYGREVEIVDVYATLTDVMPHQVHPIPLWKMEKLFRRWEENRPCVLSLHAFYTLVHR